jgi:hypothetical protein
MDKTALDRINYIICKFCLSLLQEYVLVCKKISLTMILDYRDFHRKFVK